MSKELIFIALAFAVVVWILSCSQAAPHDIYTGLKNRGGYDCCGGENCRPIPAERVRLYDIGVKRGYWIDGYFWIDEDRALPSPDSQFHICRMDHWGSAGIICFFAPYVGL